MSEPRFCVVIPIINQVDEQLGICLNSIPDGVQSILIVTPNQSVIEEITEFAAGSNFESKVSYLRFPITQDHQGYNEGRDWAKSNGYTHVIPMRQTDAMGAGLFSSIKYLCEQHEVIAFNAKKLWRINSGLQVVDKEPVMEVVCYQIDKYWLYESKYGKTRDELGFTLPNSTITSVGEDGGCIFDLSWFRDDSYFDKKYPIGWTLSKWRSGNNKSENLHPTRPDLFKSLLPMEIAKLPIPIKTSFDFNLQKKKWVPNINHELLK